jgi:hypothetical protein
MTLVAQSAHSQQQVTVDPAVGEHVLVFDQTGVYNVMLQAENDGVASTMSAQVDVRPMVTLSLEVLGGTELVRNVQHVVRVQWSVAGAKEYDGGYNIWLESSHQDGALFVPPMPLTGEQNVSIVLSSDAPEWLVTLYAEGEDQIVASVTQKIAVVYPICELTAETTTVRSGPGDAYSAILPPQPAASEPGTTLSYSPVARDQSGAWLQVPVSLDALQLGWVPRADFVCTNFDPAQLQATADYPPPPADNGAAAAPTAPAATPVPSPMPSEVLPRTPTPTTAA